MNDKYILYLLYKTINVSSNAVETLRKKKKEKSLEHSIRHS